MLDSWKTVRIFISSTFKDMQAERDHLVRFVFPRLREELLKRRIHLVDVDLRWGVTSDQDAYDVCMEEIDNCHPRFICMLGGRYGWIPPASDISITASEVNYGALDKLDEPVFRYFYFRDPEVTNSIPDEFAKDYREPSGSESEILLESLKEKIMNPETKGNILVEPDHVECKELPYYEYPCSWDNELKRIVDLELFGNQVYNDIIGSIDAEFGKEDINSINEFEKEKLTTEAFIEQKIENYVVGSRSEILDSLKNFVDNNQDNGYLCLYGEPGSGKTALMAKFYQEYMNNNDISEKIIIPVFIGSTIRSTNPLQILRRFCFELSQINEYHKKIPEDFEELKELFNLLLNQSSKPVIILIDAVNQIKNIYQSSNVSWLPKEPPQNVHILISTLPGSELDSLRNRRIPPLEEYLNPLKTSDSELIIDEFLQRYRKKFDAKQKMALMKKKDSDNPLYLSTALEELRTLGTYEEITDRILELPETVQPLFQWILIRLENDQGFQDENGNLVGSKIVREFTALIAVSRYGLSQKELTELINFNDLYGNIAALQRLLRPYLMHKDDLISFYHGQLLEAVYNLYLKEKSEKLYYHIKLAGYFYNKADPLNDCSWKGDYGHAFSELPYHQTNAEMWNKIEKTLTNLEFIQKKFSYGMAQDLINDYNNLTPYINYKPIIRTAKFDGEKYGLGCPFCLSWFELRETDLGNEMECPICDKKLKVNEFYINSEWKPNEIKKIKKNQIHFKLNDKIIDFAGFVKSEAHILSNYPENTTQQALVQPDNSSVFDSALKIINKTQKPWIKWLNKNQKNCTPILTVSAHEDKITSCAFSHEGQKVVSYSDDNYIRIWDAETGKEIKTINAHDNIKKCFFSEDGKKIISVASNNEIKKYDIKTLKNVQKLEIRGKISFSNDFDKIYSLFDSTLSIWDVKNLTKIKSYEVVSGDAKDYAISHDEKQIVFECEGIIKIFDLYTGILLKKILKDTVILTLPNKGSIIDSKDNIEKIFNNVYGDKEAYELFKTTENVLEDDKTGVKDKIRSCLFSPDGKKIAALYEHFSALIIWDVESGEERFLAGQDSLGRCMGHSGEIHSFKFSPDGKKIVTLGAYDLTLIIWDVSSGKVLKRFKGHDKNIFAWDLSPDGEKIVSASTDGILKIWNLDSNVESNYPNHTLSVEKTLFSPDGTKILSASKDNMIKVWDVNSGELTKTIDDLLWGSVWNVAFSPDGKKFAASFDSEIIGFDALDYQIIKFLNTFFFTLKGRVDICNFSPDGNRFISSSWYGDNRFFNDPLEIEMKIWDINTGNELNNLSYDYSSPIRKFEFNKDGTKALSASHVIKVWDVGTGGELLTLSENEEDNVYDFDISPDGSKILSAEKNINIWDLETGSHILKLDGDNGEKKCSFSLDETKILSSYENSMKIWDSFSGNFINILSGHMSKIIDCAFTPDGSKIVSISNDNTVRIWDVESGIELLKFFSQNRLETLALAKSNYEIVCTDASGAIYILKLKGIESDIPIVTPSLIYIHDKFDWDDNLRITCPCCGNHFVPDFELINYLQKISSDLKIEENRNSDLFKDSNLILKCDNCKNELRSTPFICDNSKKDIINQMILNHSTKNLHLEEKPEREFFNNPKIKGKSSNINSSINKSNEKKKKGWWKLW